ncbi:MAG: hypothetical protein PHO37_14805 [Kiritimatiellae bacterium]|nr:hypothetical protein [Kiritimatiellia bacterium]
MITPQIVQIISTLLFVCGASLYYGIRRTLYKQGYPVSIFVYSGPCWSHYRDLIRKSTPAAQRRLRARKIAMTLSLLLALAGVLLASVIAQPS